MANDRKRKEAKRNQMREKERHQKKVKRLHKQMTTAQTDDSQATCSTVKSRRLDSSERLFSFS